MTVMLHKDTLRDFQRMAARKRAEIQERLDDLVGLAEQNRATPEQIDEIWTLERVLEPH